MEKICIVKKRKKPQLDGKNATFLMSDPGDTLRGLLEETSVTTPKTLHHYIDQGPCHQEKLSDQIKNDVVSLKLTPEQCSYLLSNEFMDHLSADTSHHALANTQNTNDRYVIFNFHLRKPDSVQLLKVHQVCEMLQISHSFLFNLIKGKKLRSYKLGVLRRFSLDDVLTFLAKSEHI